MTERKTIRVAVAGNPNVGKSTLFNMLTGTNQHVGNYPGVTVDITTGTVRYHDYEIEFTDLPGIYSMNSYSPEERVAREFIAERTPDIILNIVDGVNLQKNMYLTLQLLEMNVPVLMFVNMFDVMEKKAIFLDVDGLSQEIETPVIAGAARKKKGIRALLKKLVSMYENPQQCTTVPYSDELNGYADRVCDVLKREVPERAVRWRAIRILEGGCEDTDELSETARGEIDAVIADLKRECNIPVNSMLIIQERYHLIKRAAEKVTTMENRPEGTDKSERIDDLVLHRVLSIPLFLLIMYTLFQGVFTLGDPLAGYLEELFSFLRTGIADIWPAQGHLFLRDLIIDGIIPGVGGVIVFTPYIFLMFFGISVLEDTGYLSRVSVIMDYYMGKMGLSGKSFLPMVLGFGCSVPAVMATRIISDPKERLVAMLVIPFISCSARLPVYLLIIAAFFPEKYQGVTLFVIYIIGILMALFLARMLRKYVVRGLLNPLFVELPDYTVPTVRSLLLLTWQRGRHFLQKAGTVILLVSMLLWVVNTFPRVEIPDTIAMTESKRTVLETSNTAMGQFSKAVEPAFTLMGGDWKIASSFIASLAAKELFVSQLSMLFATDHALEGSGEIREELQNTYSFPAAVAFLLFIMLTAPCIATFAIVRAESRSWRWPVLQFAGMTVIAWVFSVIAYQLLSLF